MKGNIKNKIRNLIQLKKIILIKSKKINDIIYFIRINKMDDEEKKDVFYIKKYLAENNRYFVDEDDLNLFEISFDKKRTLGILKAIQENYK